MTRDVYANLLRETRTMRRDQASARDRWFETLAVPQKESLLFELEMLLKGLACFTNPRNHTGAPASGSLAALDYRRQLRIVREALARASQCIRELLGERDRAFVFTRYLETLVPEDGQRRELLEHQLNQFTPEESLFVLRNAFAAFEELADGVLDASRVPYRMYSAFMGTITREIGRSAYFNPLQTLEFRAEFDRIRHPAVLSALHAAAAPAHRQLALAFLSLFRLLRYLQLVDDYAQEEARLPLAFVVLSVFRSDARALTYALERGSGDALARGFEARLLRVNATELKSRNEVLWDEAAHLRDLRSTLESTGRGLRLECHGVLEGQLPEPIADGAEGGTLVVGAAALRAAIHHALAVTASALDSSLDLSDLGSSRAMAVGASLRLRRDVWTFQQVLRAFLAKAEQSSPARDRWNGPETFGYVREFLQHFRAIGYQLARRSDYEHLDRFLETIEGLHEVDLMDPERLDQSLDDCRGFQAYLGQLFESINQRAELSSHRFNKATAADHLRRYLRA
ncbi:MAG: hypothetical protein AAF645_17135 [Myxococcota bacterium]